MLKYVGDDNKIVGLFFETPKAKTDNLAFMEEYQEEMFNLSNDVACKLKAIDHDKSDPVFQCKNIITA